MKAAVANPPLIMKDVLTVKRKEYITPHYIRIILEGKNMRTYSSAQIGDNNKIIIPKDKTQPLLLSDNLMKDKYNVPFTIRTYTMRSLDIENNEMAIDFVMHGETGPACSWAIHAEKGDELGVLMKEKRKPLFKEANYYLLVGDHTALPVISAILESLPKHAKGTAILEVYSHEDVIELQKPAHIALTWIFNSTPGANSKLVNVFENIDFNNDVETFVFAAAEYSVINTIQSLIRSHTNLAREDWYAYSYWKHGVSEDQSATERRGQQSN